MSVEDPHRTRQLSVAHRTRQLSGALHRLGRRARRGGAALAAGWVLAYVTKRVVDERRFQRRLAAPVTAWPDVPIDRLQPWSGPAW